MTAKRNTTNPALDFVQRRQREAVEEMQRLAAVQGRQLSVYEESRMNMALRDMVETSVAIDVLTRESA
jgi:hypothetical protein